MDKTPLIALAGTASLVLIITRMTLALGIRRAGVGILQLNGEDEDL